MIETITYSQIIDVVKNWIKSNCSNITNYNGMNNCVKNGYSYTVGSSGSNAWVESATASLSSSITGAVSSGTVDTDMSTFLSTIAPSISDLNVSVTPDNFYKFINDMCCFCCTKLAYVTSQSGNASTSFVRYLIYWSGNTTWSYNITINPSEVQNYFIIASDINVFWQNIVDMMTRISGNIRVLPVRYTFSLT